METESVISPISTSGQPTTVPVESNNIISSSSGCLAQPPPTPPLIKDDSSSSVIEGEWNLDACPAADRPSLSPVKNFVAIHRSKWKFLKYGSRSVDMEQAQKLENRLAYLANIMSTGGACSDDLRAYHRAVLHQLSLWRARRSGWCYCDGERHHHVQPVTWRMMEDFIEENVDDKDFGVFEIAYLELVKRLKNKLNLFDSDEHHLSTKRTTTEDNDDDDDQPSPFEKFILPRAWVTIKKRINGIDESSSSEDSDSPETLPSTPALNSNELVSMTSERETSTTSEEVGSSKAERCSNASGSAISEADHATGGCDPSPKRKRRRVMDTSTENSLVGSDYDSMDDDEPPTHPVCAAGESQLVNSTESTGESTAAHPLHAGSAQKLGAAANYQWWPPASWVFIDLAECDRMGHWLGVDNVEEEVRTLDMEGLCKKSVLVAPQVPASTSHKLDWYSAWNEAASQGKRSLKGYALEEDFADVEGWDSNLGLPFAAAREVRNLCSALKHDKKFIIDEKVTLGEGPPADTTHTRFNMCSGENRERAAHGVVDVVIEPDAIDYATDYDAKLQNSTDPAPVTENQSPFRGMSPITPEEEDDEPPDLPSVGSSQKGKPASTTNVHYNSSLKRRRITGSPSSPVSSQATPVAENARSPHEQSSSGGISNSNPPQSSSPQSRNNSFVDPFEDVRSSSMGLVGFGTVHLYKKIPVKPGHNPSGSSSMSSSKGNSNANRVCIMSEKAAFFSVKFVFDVLFKVFEYVPDLEMISEQEITRFAPCVFWSCYVIGESDYKAGLLKALCFLSKAQYKSGYFKVKTRMNLFRSRLLRSSAVGMRQRTPRGALMVDASQPYSSSLSTVPASLSPIEEEHHPHALGTKSDSLHGGVSQASPNNVSSSGGDDEYDLRAENDPDGYLVTNLILRRDTYIRSLLYYFKERSFRQLVVQSDVRKTTMSTDCSFGYSEPNLFVEHDTSSSLTSTSSTCGIDGDDYIAREQRPILIRHFVRFLDMAMKQVFPFMLLKHQFECLGYTNCVINKKIEEEVSSPNYPFSEEVQQIELTVLKKASSQISHLIDTAELALRSVPADDDIVGSTGKNDTELPPNINVAIQWTPCYDMLIESLKDLAVSRTINSTPQHQASSGSITCTASLIAQCYESLNPNEKSARLKRERRQSLHDDPEVVLRFYLDDHGFSKHSLLKSTPRQREILMEKAVRNNYWAPVFVGYNEKGRACFASANIYAGDFICEYAGRFSASFGMAKYWESQYAELGRGSYLFFFVNPYTCGRCCIDGTQEAVDSGFARLINHSRKKPNLVAFAMKSSALLDNGKRLKRPRLVFVALKDIEIGEELLIDYGEENPEALKANPWLAET